jgi:outer membrane protein assembly factor BamD
MKRILLILSILVLLLSSCSDYQKLLKSNDFQERYDKAREYYNAEDFLRSYNLFESIRTVYRGTSKAPTIAYYTAYCSYGQEDYITAGDLFDNFIKTFPTASYVEECMYMRAYCYYLSSPIFRLDQAESLRAIESFQVFMSRYPLSAKVADANKYIDELRDKLAYKEFEGAKLYYDMEKYKAAIISLQNCLTDFPESKHREEVLYLLFSSRYELAVHSIEKKKAERYNEAREEYLTFVDEYPESEFKNEMERKYKNIDSYLVKLEVENK